MSDQSDQSEQPSAAPPAPGRERRRGRQTVGDMVRSMLVVLALVLVVVALRGGDGPGERVRPFDYSGALASAREQAPYEVLAPVGLPAEWTPTSARSGRDGDTFTWHLGFVTPAGDYAGLEQGDGDPEAFLDAVADGGRDAGTTRIDGLRWRRVEGGSPEQRVLVLEGEAVTTLVGGGAAWAELRALARTLRTS